jgi:hypothetical protein
MIDHTTAVTIATEHLARRSRANRLVVQHEVYGISLRRVRQFKLLTLTMLVGTAGCGRRDGFASTGAMQATASRATTLEHRRNTSIITRADGGLVEDLGYGISVHPKSLLKRVWITVNDSVLPLHLVGNVGVRPIDGGYVSRYIVRARDSITAFEVRFVVFNVWGDVIRTLSGAQVQDIDAGDDREVLEDWSVDSQKEATECYASLGFVARVRTRSGKVYAANMDPILDVARKLSAKFTAADLEPSPQPAPTATTATAANAPTRGRATR